MNIARNLACAGLALLLVAGAGAAAGEDQPPSATLRVLSYNIRHGEGTDGKLDLRRIAGVIAKQKPDLVALQEVDKGCKRTGNRDLAKELGALLGMQHRFGKFMDYQGGAYGMAILSRLPITGMTRHPLPKGAEPRCALEVRVTVKGLSLPVSLVCIHNDWTNEAIRVKQVQALLNALKDHTGPVVLAGDFNGQPDDASMKLLAKAPWKILAKSGSTKTYPSAKPVKEIDYIVIRGLVTSSIKHAVIDERIASDHRPILADMVLQ